MKKTVIELQNIKRNFQVGDETVHALRGVSFSIQEGESDLYSRTTTCCRKLQP